MADENESTALGPGDLLDEERVLRIYPLSTIKSDISGQNLKVYDTTTRIATWNMRSMYHMGKVANVGVKMWRCED